MERFNTPTAPLGTGYLTVQVTTASSAIPLSGAQVTVSNQADRNNVLYEVQSGRDGKTPTLAQRASQSPHP